MGCRPPTHHGLLHGCAGAAGGHQGAVCGAGTAPDAEERGCGRWRQHRHRVCALHSRRAASLQLPQYRLPPVNLVGFSRWITTTKPNMLTAVCALSPRTTPPPAHTKSGAQPCFLALHSTGSASPTSHLGPGSPFDGGGASYLADVLDQLGDDIAGRCAWDTEPWATLRQQLVAAGGPPAPPTAGTTFNVRRWHCCSACLIARSLRQWVSACSPMCVAMAQAALSSKPAYQSPPAASEVARLPPRPSRPSQRCTDGVHDPPWHAVGADACGARVGPRALGAGAGGAGGQRRRAVPRLLPLRLRVHLRPAPGAKVWNASGHHAGSGLPGRPLAGHRKDLLLASRSICQHAAAQHGNAPAHKTCQRRAEASMSATCFCRAG